MRFDTRNKIVDLSCPSQCFQGCLMCQCLQQKMKLLLLSNSCMFKHHAPLWTRIPSIKSYIRGSTRQVSAFNLHIFLAQKVAFPMESKGVRGLHGKGHYSQKWVCLLCHFFHCFRLQNFKSSEKQPSWGKRQGSALSLFVWWENKSLSSKRYQYIPKLEDILSVYLLFLLNFSHPCKKYLMLSALFE